MAFKILNIFNFFKISLQNMSKGLEVFISVLSLILTYHFSFDSADLCPCKNYLISNYIYAINVKFMLY